jgi:predicted esterase
MNRLAISHGRWLSVFFVFLAACLLLNGVPVSGDEKDPPAKAGEEGLFSLPGNLPDKLPDSPAERYEVKLDQEKFYLFVPKNYNARESFGLVAFIYAADEMNVPADWKKTLAARKMLYIAPQNVGNNREVARRVTLGIVAIRKMMELYNIDAKRVYIAGHSGGAKVACRIAYTQPDLVHGVIANCAALQPSDSTSDKDALEKIKSQVGIAIITGPKDFNYDGLKQIGDSLAKDEYRAKLFDVPGMGHQIAKSSTLVEAMNWFEPREKPASADKSSKAKETTEKKSATQENKDKSKEKKKK